MNDTSQIYGNDDGMLFVVPDTRKVEEALEM